MELNSLKDLLVHQLKDLYNAEKQITNALPKMLEKAHDQQLKQAFELHLNETQEQIQRLEQVFDILGVKGDGEKCKAMEGIIREAEDLMSQNAEADVMDAGLISSAQRVEHYEMAGYGTVCTFAKRLGMNDIAEILSQTLEEEKRTDFKLTQIAESSVNRKAE